MNLYRNQNSGQNTTSPVVNTARDLNHLANYSPETTHLGLNEGEEKTAYLFRLFGEYSFLNLEVSLKTCDTLFFVS